MDFGHRGGKDSFGQNNHSIAHGLHRTPAATVKTKADLIQDTVIHRNITGKSRHDFTEMTTSVTGSEFTGSRDFPSKVSKPVR
jgi:hypothetical protein